MSKILKLYLRPAKKAPLREVEKAEAVAGRGLAGDHADGGDRQLTLLDASAWGRACDELGSAVDPSGRRANVLVDGELPLAETIGRRLRLGPCEIEVVGETTPCEKQDALASGLQEALRPERRAGVYGRIVKGGAIAVGDCVEFV